MASRSSISIPASDVAVSVRNGFMKYRNGQMVLKNFNMTVPCGTIYSLLGPSGCGKTTVLSAIVGVQPLTSGNVEIFGKRPGTSECGVPGPVLGYMPQGITLYDNLTICESFIYFGRIYGMKESQIDGKINDLSSLLRLPPSSSRILTLSGGQKRRVSLALCLLHDPKLLILDEPTVGVDPLLRERIWNHLHQIVAENKVTVIITTHYVEETKDSTTLGIIRNGRMLIEESPQVLMNQYNSPFLEDIVTKLFKAANEDDHDDHIIFPSSLDSRLNCVEGTYFRKIDPDITSYINLQNNNRSSPILQSKDQSYNTEPFHTTQNNTHNLKLRSSRYLKIKALVVRNIFKTYIRNILYLFMFLTLPAFNGCLVHFVVGVPPVNLNFGFVSPEIQNYSSTTGCSGGCNELSCNFVHRLTSTIISPIQMKSEVAALDSIAKGETSGFLKFTRNYSRSLIGRLISGNFPEDELLRDSEVVIRMDQSDFIVAYYLRKIIYETYLKFVANAIEVCNSNERIWITQPPLKFRQPVFGKDDDSNGFVSQTVLLLITFFIPMMSTSHEIILDRKSGTMDRTLVAGVSKLESIIAMTITEGGAILVQASISYVIGTQILNWDIQGSHLSVMVLMFITGVFGMAASFLLAQFCEHEIEAILIAIGIFISHLSITGIIWPLEGLNSPVQKFLINLTPLNWAIDALRSVIIRGWPLYHTKVYPTIVVLLSATLLSLILGSKLWRRI